MGVCTHVLFVIVFLNVGGFYRVLSFFNDMKFLSSELQVQIILAE